MRRIYDKDCPACYRKDCDCECKTCVDAKEFNSKHTQAELDILNLAEAMKISGTNDD